MYVCGLCIYVCMCVNVCAFVYMNVCKYDCMLCMRLYMYVSMHVCKVYKNLLSDTKCAVNIVECAVDLSAVCF